MYYDRYDLNNEELEVMSKETGKVLMPIFIEKPSHSINTVFSVLR